jgi:4-hydroxy 2-oxovalerate aldolase
MMQGRDVLILGSGPGVAAHRSAVEAFIRRESPLVLALNTQSAIADDLIDLRIASHPVRLLADAAAHQALPQPLVTPASVFGEQLKGALKGKAVLDFGLAVKSGVFHFDDTHCIAPTSLVLAYALAVVTAGDARQILMAGFDGYAAGDPRNNETAEILDAYDVHIGRERLLAITPTRHQMPVKSAYAPY